LPDKSRIILASASPRRQELLRKAGIEFVVRPADIPEVPLADESPQVFAERMAREKALAVRDLSSHEAVLAADTVVTVAGEILGKPKDEHDAARMLRLLSGRKHLVISGVCLAGMTFEDVRSETTSVHFAAVSEEEIRDYVRGGEPMDKAGAYAIQGGASRFVTNVEGDYNNVVGLPVDLVLRMLREHGVL
jgi:septum formation protein